ncbi:hypothetical protein YK56LOC_68560 [Caballeronia sp. HLA56]
MRSTLRLRFDYGALPPWSMADGDTMVAKVGPDLVVLRTPFPLEVKSHVVETETETETETEFEVQARSRVAFVMSYGPSHQPAPAAIDAEAALVATRNFWRNWIARFDDSTTDWPHKVRRSHLTLKALIHQSSGGLIAAPTTSLPEAPGCKMNWEYRDCWLRDASFTLGALFNAGFHGEAQAWRNWLLRAIAGSPDRMRIM